MIVFGQVSDTHFGAVLANTRASRTPHQSAHALPLCLKLHAALDNVRAANGFDQVAPLPIVHSGDLTGAGDAAEFAIGQLFMRGRARIARSKTAARFGLDVQDEHLLAMVPGNHDHWAGLSGGLNYLAGPPARSSWVAPTHFRPTPWHKRWASVHPDDDAVVLDLFGVDSNSGFAVGQASYLAKGEISTAEFQSLEALLQHCRADRRGIHLRAIVCHHSPSYRGGLLRTNELHPTSRAQLLDLCGRYDVHALLTGHTHDFHAAALATPAGGVVHELRCASTLALGQPLNGFLVHRIAIDRSGQRTWTCDRHAWNGSNFVRNGTPLVQFAV